MNRLTDWVGRSLGRWLSKPIHAHGTSPPTPTDLLIATLRPCDVLLVEGQARVSVAIKYLTQSTWSHAALYVGDCGGNLSHGFVEADLVEGVRIVDPREFQGLHTRICRPVGLDKEDQLRIVAYALGRVGHQYDLRNVTDLMRFLIPAPPVPRGWRRRMLALGSGDPTRAICSTLVAQCFQSVRYPILPMVETKASQRAGCAGCLEEIMRVRHHSLFVPRDFDVSPYFQVIKPTLERGFDYHQLYWAELSASP